MEVTDKSNFITTYSNAGIVHNMDNLPFNASNDEWVNEASGKTYSNSGSTQKMTLRLGGLIAAIAIVGAIIAENKTHFMSDGLAWVSSLSATTVTYGLVGAILISLAYIYRTELYNTLILLGIVLSLMLQLLLLQ